MARRTKADAQATRLQLLQAAVRVFGTKGVSRTSLQDIAEAAGTTRGAIYWHFKNKADLFNAMMDDALLPMEQAMRRIGHDAAQDPLAELEHALLQTMRDIVSTDSTRAVFEISRRATFKFLAMARGKSPAACVRPQRAAASTYR